MSEHESLQAIMEKLEELKDKVEHNEKLSEGQIRKIERKFLLTLIAFGVTVTAAIGVVVYVIDLIVFGLM